MGKFDQLRVDIQTGTESSAKTQAELETKRMEMQLV